MKFEEEFITLVKELFPSIDPYIAANVKNSVQQFYKDGKTFSCYNASALKGITQGDIISNVTFAIIDSEGEIATYRTAGLVLSNSCDIENDDYILLAPFEPINQLGFDQSQINELKMNTLYGYIYFPDVSEEQVAVNLSRICALPKKIIRNSLKNKTMEIKHSLNLVGFYLLLCKLTIHFMRPEDTDLQNEREHLVYSY
ncbi:MAG: hypothetical protein BKP49_07770 [Treponema sp. CETP13]|nr:MAG: hypothetical protein BKP49_07770 [Treponema sp. CETP13]